MVLLFAVQNSFAAYYWQMTKVTTATGGGQTYCQYATANPLTIGIEQCSGGITQPHYTTTVMATWYANTSNSNQNGTPVQQYLMSTQKLFGYTIDWTPPTNDTGTLYYYVEFTDPSMTTCGFTDTLRSEAQSVTVIPVSKYVDVQTACYSLTWIDGNVYTESDTTATFIFPGASANGCDSIIYLKLTIDTISDRSTSVNGFTISAGLANASYQWLNCDDNYSKMEGETGQSFTADANGNYAVQITENGCTDTSDCVTITGVGFGQSPIKGSVLLYPNPTKGTIHLVFSENQSSVTISVRSIAGQLLSEVDFHSVNEAAIVIAETPGIYFIEIEDAAGNKTIRRITKE